MKNKLIILGFAGVLLASCAGEETTETPENEEVVKVEENCTYQYDSESTVIGWTAFKFTEKTGVKGFFENADVMIPNQSEDMLQTLSGATFTIPVNSVNSQNPERDVKIQNHFFGTMEATEVISGMVKSIDNKTALVDLSMNGKTVEYNGNVTVDGEKVIFETTINMVDFEAQSSIDSLNNVCEVLHTGTDGVSKLWSEVDIKVETTLVKDCK